jgi:hypothetical protein
MSRKSKATKVKDLTNYAGEVAVFELSKGIKKGAITFKHIVVARSKPISGFKNTDIFLSDPKGVINYMEPIHSLSSKDMSDALDQIGYQLI